MTADRRTIVITGVTRGLGRALVDRFAETGHTVVGCGRSKTAIKTLRTGFDPRHRFDALDIGEWPEVEAWSASVQETHGAPRLLINNAGVMNRPAPLWQIEDDELRALLRINVAGTANVIRAFLPAMITKGHGVIVNMSSGWGRSTAPEVAPYCASKWAIEGLTRALAQEVPPGLAAVAVNPGIIDTEMLRTCWDDAAASFPPPESWAESAAAFLLSLSTTNNGKSLDM